MSVIQATNELIDAVAVRLPAIIEAAGGYHEIFDVDLSRQPLHPPGRLVVAKFLRGRDLDVERTCKALEETLKWRKEFNPISAAFEEDFGDQFDGIAYITQHGDDIVCWTLFGEQRCSSRDVRDLTVTTRPRRERHKTLLHPLRQIRAVASGDTRADSCSYKHQRLRRRRDSRYENGNHGIRLHRREHVEARFTYTRSFAGHCTTYDRQLSRSSEEVVLPLDSPLPPGFTTSVQNVPLASFTRQIRAARQQDRYGSCEWITRFVTETIRRDEQ